MIIWRLIRASIASFLADDALTRGAAIAFYLATSLSPVLLIVTSIAGLVFGRDIARGYMVLELSSVMGPDGANLVNALIAKSSDPASGSIATAIGIATIVISASGIFGEMQAALNIVWRARAPRQRWLSFVRARATSLGLVAALGLMLVVSLGASTALSAFGHYLGAAAPWTKFALSVVNTLVSLLLFGLLFAAIFKVLPDTSVAWRDVWIGAFATAFLFTIGKSAIGWYLGEAAPASAYGAAGSLVMLMLWTYYSAQIFLLGAEFTRAVADERHGPAAPQDATP